MCNGAIVAYPKAKLNLTMEILGRRSDGYHEIASFMQFISLCDRLEIEKSEDFNFWCDDESLLGDDNLVVKGYKLLKEKFNIPAVSIKLYKNIPYMAGMGGGSADCAETLKCLNKLFDLGIEEDELCKLGKTLGADIPACIMGGSLVAKGIGEKLEKVERKSQLNFVVIMPPAGFNTQHMYRRIDAEGIFTCGIKTDMLRDAVKSDNIEAVYENIYNGFIPALDDPDFIESIKAQLLSLGAETASMTGAGSAVFGIFETEEKAKSAYDILKANNTECYLCSAV